MSDEPRAPASRAARWLAWVPLGLWTAGVLAAARSAALLAHRMAAAGAVTSGEEDVLRWDVASMHLTDTLPAALVIGLLSAKLAQLSADPDESPGTGPLGLGAFSLAAMLALLSGWPLAPAAQRVGLGDAANLGLDNLAVLAAIALGATAMLFQLSRWVASGRRLRVLFAGPLALALAALAALLPPAGWALSVTRAGVAFEQRVVEHDWLAAESWETLAAPEDAAPSARVVTPAVFQYSDSADKPSIALPPGSSVRLPVPPGARAATFRAAAGIDRSTRGRWARVVVDFEVRVDGAPVFERRVVSERKTGAAWDPADWVWHHVGDGDGVPVEGGAEITLHARLVAEESSPDVVAAEVLCGFGSPVLERRVRRARQHPRPGAPSIVLVVMDTLRADRMSAYGYARPTTPHLDRLAERGLLFESAYATSSWTWPSTASILTGLPVDAHGVKGQDACTLGLSLESLPEVLQARGFTTAAFSCNPLIARERYFDQGFEHFDDPPRDRFRMSDEVIDDIQRWVELHAGTRFFLYLHLADPHTPHLPHPDELARIGATRPADFPDTEVDGRIRDGIDHYTWLLHKEGRPSGEVVPAQHQQWIHDVYDASVATGDRYVGALLGTLAELGLEDRTIVAFTSDHGEELFDHDRLGHGHTVHRELVRVPLILAGPGVPIGARAPMVVSNRHLAPTLAALGGGVLDGIGDGHFLLEEDGPGHALFQTSKGRWGGAEMQTLYGLREADWTLHWRVDESITPGDVRLYDASGDPAETLDYTADDAVRAAEMRQKIAASVDAQRAHAPLVFGGGASAQNTYSEIGYAGGDGDEEEQDDARGARNGDGDGERPGDD